MTSTTTRTDAEIEADVREFLTGGGAWASPDLAHLGSDDAAAVRQEARDTWGLFADDDRYTVEAIIRRVIVEVSR